MMRRDVFRVTADWGPTTDDSRAHGWDDACGCGVAR